LATPEQAAAVVGQRDLAGGAMEQPDAELRLEPRDRLGERRRRAPHLARRRREVASLGGLGKGEQRLQSLHSILLFLNQMPLPHLLMPALALDTGWVRCIERAPAALPPQAIPFNSHRGSNHEEATDH